MPFLRASRVSHHGRCHKFADAGARPWQQAARRPGGAKDLEQRVATQQTSFTCCATELLREAGSRKVLASSRL